MTTPATAFLYDAPLSKRFRGFYPVIIDVETAGFNPKKNALLEIAAVTLTQDDDGWLIPLRTYFEAVVPFEGSVLEAEALAFTGIQPFHPFRMAKPEDQVLQQLFQKIRADKKDHDCPKAVLVGHNASFDLNFLNEAVARQKIKRNPFHPFTNFDTATLAAFTVGQSVLSRAVTASGLNFDSKSAHCAKYDAQRTAELFCTLINQWRALGTGSTPPKILIDGDDFQKIVD